MKWRNQYAFDPEIRQAHNVFRSVPIPVIKAVIAKESGFNAKAIRGEPHIGDASRGLMQLLLSTARDVGYTGTPDGLFNPAVNVYYGTRLLSDLIGTLGNWDDAISAYNGGNRPQLGFGRKATREIRGICLARNASGKCIRRVNVQPGEYANQGYVAKVREFIRYFAHDRAEGEGQTPKGKSGVAIPNVVKGVGGVGLLLLGALAYFSFRG